MVKMEMKIIMKWKLCIFVYLNYWLSSKLFAYLSFGRKWYGKEVCEVLVNNEKFCYISWNLAAKFIFTYMYFIYMYKFYSQKTFFSPLNMLIKIVYVCVCAYAQLCPTLCDPMGCSLPGCSVHEIFQARILEWVTISSARDSSQPVDRTCMSCVCWVFCIAGGLFTLHCHYPNKDYVIIKYFYW